MKLDTPEIAWHGKEPILSVDFSKTGSTWRLASAGADNDVKIWSVVYNEQQQAEIEFLANLSRHTKAVNVVRFSPKEDILASGGDDCMIILWKLNSSTEQNTSDIFMGTDDVQNKETWTFYKPLRGHIEDVYDLAWSPDGNSLVSGSVDNSAIIWDVVKGQKLMILKEAKHYVQGVCWDPFGQYIATNSSDRSCRLYNPHSYRCCYNITKLPGNGAPKTTENGESFKQGRMFHDETMPSFFRRPSYSPDGSLLFVPAGRLDVGEQVVNTTYVFTRIAPNKPVLYLPSPQKASVAVRCCPTLFELKPGIEGSEDQSTESLFKLPYRMVFAIATLDSILLYDTQQKSPFAYVSNIHYAALTDITWSHDGNILVVSSSDGYCSILHFNDGELGEPYNLSVKDVLQRSVSPLPQTNSDTSGKMGKKITLTPYSENSSNGEKIEEPTQSSAKKETVGRISLFTVPIKDMPTKPANQTTPKRVAVTPVPVQPSPVNTLTSASTAKQITPRHATLLPVMTNQPITSTKEVTATNQIAQKHATPKRVTLKPVLTTQPDTRTGEVQQSKRITLNHEAQAPVEARPVSAHAAIKTDEAANQHLPSPVTLMPGLKQPQRSTEVQVLPGQTGTPILADPTVCVTSSPLSTPVISAAPPSNAPRRMQLISLSSDVAGAAVPSSDAVVLPNNVREGGVHQNVKENSPSCKPSTPQEIPRPTATEDSRGKDDSTSTLAAAEPNRTQLTPSAEVQASFSGDKAAKQGSTVLSPINLEVGKTPSSSVSNTSQPRRISLTSVPVETSKSNSNQVPAVVSGGDKENSKTSLQLGDNSQSKPRRVMLTTLENKTDQNVGSENNSSQCQLKSTSKKPIPLEPTVIVLDDD